MKISKLTSGSTVFILLLLASLSLAPLAAVAQQSDNTQSSGNTSESNGSQTAAMVGGMSTTELDRINKEGAAKVAAIKPTQKALSQKDQTLLLELAKSGMHQLMLSQVAVQKTTNDQIRTLAQAEVEEQTGLAAKVKQIATAKGVDLPSRPDTQTQQLLSQFNTLTGNEIDRYYISEGGVKGHEQLDKLMTTLNAEATDPNLKSLEEAAHPLVLTHLKVSKAMLQSMTAPVGNK